MDVSGDPGNEDTKEFFDFTYDAELAVRTSGITIIHSSNDMETIQKSVDILQANIHNIKYVELINRGHFYDDNSYEFPELIEEVLI